MPDLGPATPEGAISHYVPLLCGMIANSITGVDARLKWDRVRMRLDNLQAQVGVKSAQDVRHRLMRELEAERDKVMLLDVRMEVDAILSELRNDLARHGATNKRSLEELLS